MVNINIENKIEFIDSMNVSMSVDGENGNMNSDIEYISLWFSFLRIWNLCCRKDYLFLLYFSTYTNFKNKMREQGNIIAKGNNF